MTRLWSRPLWATQLWILTPEQAIMVVRGFCMSFYFLIGFFTFWLKVKYNDLEGDNFLSLNMKKIPKFVGGKGNI